MSHYYYLAASLPLFPLGELPHFNVEKFETMCAGHLSPADMAGLQELTGDPALPAVHPFVRVWRAFEVRLRNTIVRVRAHRRQTDATPHLVPDTGYDAHIEHGVHEAFGHKTPLDRELALDRLRWAETMRIAGFDAFSGDAVLAYALRLHISARWAELKVERGRHVLGAILDAVTLPSVAAG